MLGHDDLRRYYKSNFALMQHHKYNLYDLENMIPWERIIYIELLQQYLKQESEKVRDQAAVNKRKR